MSNEQPVSDIEPSSPFQKVMAAIQEEVSKVGTRPLQDHVMENFLRGFFGNEGYALLRNGVHSQKAKMFQLLQNLPTEESDLADKIEAAVTISKAAHAKALKEGKSEDHTNFLQQVTDATSVVARKVLATLGQTYALRIPTQGGRSIGGNGVAEAH